LSVNFKIIDSFEDAGFTPIIGSEFFYKILVCTEILLFLSRYLYTGFYILWIDRGF